MSPLARNPRFLFGAFVLLSLVLVAAFAPWLAPHDPMEQSLLNQLLPPRWVKGGDPAFLLGTDTLGRDLLSRMIYGTLLALLVMVLGPTVSGLVGILLGMLAGYFGGWVEAAVSRTVDTFMSFP